jgi:hypothetical protein
MTAALAAEVHFAHASSNGQFEIVARSWYERYITAMIDKSAAGIRTVITGAILQFIRSTIARKTSGPKVLIDRLKAIHGP